MLALLPACTVDKGGTGYLGDGAPTNVVRADGGDTAPRTDTAPFTPAPDTAAPAAGDAAPEAPPPAPMPDAAPPPTPMPDAAPPPPAECTPGAGRCVDKLAQLCTAQGAWQPIEQCQFLCTAGKCSGVCTPGAVSCMGTKRRTCRADASGYDEMDCPAPAGGIATCREGTCGSECNDPNRRFRCGNACCQCMRDQDCPAKNVCTSGTCRYQAPAIQVTGGFYGRNCVGMGLPAVPPNARPDRTAHLAMACNGKTSCEYDVDHTVIGDPAAGCGKIYEATWQCVSGATRTSHMATLPAEASFGPTLKLACAP